MVCTKINETGAMNFVTVQYSRGLYEEAPPVIICTCSFGTTESGPRVTPFLWRRIGVLRTGRSSRVTSLRRSVLYEHCTNPLVLRLLLGAFLLPDSLVCS